MEACLLAIAAGAVALLFVPVLPVVHYLAAAALVIMLAALRWRQLWPLVCLLLSLAWSSSQAQQYLAERPPFAIEDKPFKVQVRIQGLPEDTPYGLRFRVKPLQLQSRLDYRLPLASDWLLTTSQMLPVRPNQVWLLTVALRRPHGIASAGAFDYQQWLMSEQITATGKVSRGQLLAPADWSVDEWRLQLRERFQQAFAANGDAGVCLALLTGDRALVPDQAWALYAASGVSHLMAISGTHVMLAASALAWLFASVMTRWPTLFLLRPRQEMLLPLILATALAYGALAGLSLPTMRTLMVVGFGLALAWFRRETAPLRLLLRAFVVMVLWQPLSVHAAGFWLSFGAVALLLLSSGWRRRQHTLIAFSRLQLWLTLALMPLTLCFFGRLSLVAPLANILAIPWVGLVIVPLDLLGLAAGMLSPDWQVFFWSMASVAMAGLNGFLSWLVQWPVAQQFWVLSPLALCFLLLAIVLALLPATIAPRILALLLLLPVLFGRTAVPTGGLRMSVLDVGQGLSVLLQTRRHTLLYDTGASFNTGDRVINPYLHWSGIDQLDALMISHNDKDHTGGADAVLTQTRLIQAYYSAPPAGYHLPAAVSRALCQAGQHWQWDDVSFQVLSPLADMAVKKDNDRSCVLRVSGDGFSVLLTGDIEIPTEQKLVRVGGTLASEVLVLGHHGSKTSSSPGFLAAVQPRRAIVSAGYHNQFGHPSPSVVERLRKMQVVIDNTVDAGTLVYLFQPQQNLHTEAWRQRGHYWLNSP